MAKPPSPKGKQPGVTPVLGGLLFVGLIVVSLPTVILLAVSMMPTGVAWVVDRTSGKHATFSVGGLNFAGVFPFVMEMWAGDHSIAAAMGVLSNVFSLAIIFGCAAFGWLIYLGVPPVVATFLQVIQESRINTLRQTQRKIIEEWGEEVAKSEDSLALDPSDASRDIVNKTPPKPGSPEMGAAKSPEAPKLAPAAPAKPQPGAAATAG